MEGDRCFGKMKRQMMQDFVNLIKSYPNRRELSKKSDVALTTINNWIYSGVEPSLSNAERTLKAMGYKLTIEKIKEGEE